MLVQGGGVCRNRSVVLALRGEVAIHVGDGARDGDQEFFAILVIDWWLFRKRPGVGLVFLVGERLVGEGEDREKPHEHGFVVKDFLPGLFAHVYASHEADAPIVAVGSAIVILEEQREEEFLRSKCFTYRVPMMQKMGEQEMGGFSGLEEFIQFGEFTGAEDFRKVFGGGDELRATMESGEKAVEFFQIHGTVFGKLIEKFAKCFEFGIEIAVEAFGFFVVLVHTA